MSTISNVQNRWFFFQRLKWFWENHSKLHNDTKEKCHNKCLWWCCQELMILNCNYSFAVDTVTLVDLLKSNSLSRSMCIFFCRMWRSRLTLCDSYLIQITSTWIQWTKEIYWHPSNRVVFVLNSDLLGKDEFKNWHGTDKNRKRVEAKQLLEQIIINSF